MEETHTLKFTGRYGGMDTYPELPRKIVIYGTLEQAREILSHLDFIEPGQEGMYEIEGDDA